MKFTGLTISLALAGLGYSAALPGLGDLGGPLAGLTGAATKIVGPVTSAAGAPTGALKRDDTDGLRETIKAFPSLAHSTVGTIGSAVGTTQNAVAGAGLPAKRELNNVVGIPFGSAGPAVINQAKTGDLTGAAGTAEHAIAGAGLPAKRQPNDLPVSALGKAIPAIVQGASTGALTGAFKRDGNAALGETIPSPADSGIAIAGSAVGTGKKIVSGAASTAENAAGHP
ncbi:hypothetical protein N7463_003767 [Penicillium fimorum]|uniref:Uncharacterized protein n=1 Tax=Penicillium fimorum TaxID=1882269 RepID=A0A9W9Y357_9EURO|nr:hypothetical protein N7463_003767 [Penicillium fimorum]